ncbi:MAG TPA: hypothetical protein PLV61_16890, partial [Parvularculaceae bacterium]|nr:hypothetical protein [Parvularculaceae bacterium]
MSVSNLLLNFSPVTLNGEGKHTVGFRAFDAEVLSELRRTFSETHVFRANREDDTIIDIPTVAGAEPLSDKTETIDLHNEWRYWPALLNAAL